MPDAFIVRAVLAGLGVAMVAGPLGCFVVWRRLAYFGDSLAHAALLGVALGLLLGLEPMLGVVLTCLAGALLMTGLERRQGLAADTLLGVMAHASLALALVLLGLIGGIRVDLMGYLFGDVLAVSWPDLVWIWGGGLLVLAALARLWPALVLATVDEDLARAEGVPVARLRFALVVLMALTVALAMKLVGVLLITALLIVPAATARIVATGPVAMAGLAVLAGAGAVLLGLAASLWSDAPAGPAIVVAGLAQFILVVLLVALRRRTDVGRAVSSL